MRRSAAGPGRCPYVAPPSSASRVLTDAAERYSTRTGSPQRATASMSELSFSILCSTRDTRPFQASLNAVRSSLLTSQIRIRVGEYDFSSIQERLPYVERGVAKKVVHPKYNFFTYEYDLALVRLESALTFAAHISPICLPATDDLLIGENATVTGWGRLSEGGTLPTVLQEVILSLDVIYDFFFFFHFAYINFINS